MFRSIVNTFSNCFRIPELKSRILFTLGILFVCRLIAFIRIPGLDGAELQNFYRQMEAGGGGLLNLYAMFTGGAVFRCAVGSLGIMPYITATIIIQLLTAVLPQLSKLAREEGGRAKIIQYGRYLTVLVCLVQGTAMTIGWERPQALFNSDKIGQLVLYGDNLIWWYRIQTLLILTTGTMLLMWLGEQITERGIGNGVSLVITIGILGDLPAAATGVWDMFFAEGSDFHFGHALALLLLLVGVIAGVIAITQAQRKVPVQYAQRAVGRKIFSGSTSFLPLKVNFPGVMPVIFASALLMFPQTILSWLAAQTELSFFNTLARALDHTAPTYLLVFGLLILFFSYFWVATQFNELQIADDLKKNGGYIPGVRPGQATSDYLHNAMSRITLAGAIFLTAIAVIPIILQNTMKIQPTVAQFFGGTSVLITIGVMLDTMRQVESHLMMRHYDGFLKKGRIRGRSS
jgi:preprotein translocase subunit SecY